MKSIKLQNVYLATENPRIADRINYGDVNGNFFRSKQTNDDESNLKKMLSYEGNLDNLLELFRSIAEGYNEMLDLPFLIHSKNEDEYIVVEGNRRIMVLKCLNSLLEFPKKINDHNKSLIEDETTYDYGNDDVEIDTKKIESNLKKIHRVIDEYRKSHPNQEEFKFNIIEQNEDEKKRISIAIFSNHITGDRRGKRNWNRGKTLDMYMNFWNTIDEKEDKTKIKEISKLLNRSERDVQRNIYSASLIYYLIDKSGENRNDYYKKIKISSLELQFIKKFINFNQENRWDKNIEYQQDLNYENLILRSKNGKFSKKALAKFIIDSLSKGYFSTRGVNQKNKEKINDDISLFFKESSGSIEESYEKTFNQIGELNINLAIRNKNNFKNQELKKALDFISKNKEIANKFKINYSNKLSTELLLEPFQKVFKNLFTQYKLLTQNYNITKIQDYPINAIMSTLRSIIENFCYLLMYDKTILNDFKKAESFKNIDIEKGLEKSFESIFLNEKNNQLHNTYTFLRKEGKDLKKEILNAMRNILNNNSIQNIDNLLNIFDTETFREVSKIIHSPHLLLLDKNTSIHNTWKKNKLFLEDIIKFFKELKIIV